MDLTAHSPGNGERQPSVPLDSEHDVQSVADIERFLAAPQFPEARSVSDLLLAQGVINQDQHRRARQLANTKGSLHTALRDIAGVDEETLQRAYAKTLGLPYVDLKQFAIDQIAVNAVPAAIARDNGVIPLCLLGAGIVAATADPADQKVRECLALGADHPFELVVASHDQIERAISQWYGPVDDAEALQEVRDMGGAQVSSTVIDLERLGREKPVVKLVHNILMDAIRHKASDVHFRPMEDRVDLLFRLDGALVKMRSFEKSMLRSVVSRIKIIGNMDIAEHRLPQDGRFRMSQDSGVVDLRLSVIPMVQGESVVIRILDSRAGLKSLDQLGLSDSDEQRFSELMSRTAGMVLVTGPTGCGKSTTLYAALQQIRQRDLNIVTVEDPVEYRLAGVNQIQANQATGLTFARALRHILRHDPDVVMVGEIRDVETAKMALESSLTGHLVLSTLHTNDAASAVTRMVEIGVEPYLVNTSLMAVLAQRLVRRNCPDCIDLEPPEPMVRRALALSEEERFFKGKGCSHCYGTGYRGRRAVYELLMVTPSVRELVMAGTSATEIKRLATSEGMRPLTDNALELARNADTSLAEVYRVRLT